LRQIGGEHRQHQPGLFLYGDEQASPEAEQDPREHACGNRGRQAVDDAVECT